MYRMKAGLIATVMTLMILQPVTAQSDLERAKEYEELRMQELAMARRALAQAQAEQMKAQLAHMQLQFNTPRVPSAPHRLIQLPQVQKDLELDQDQIRELKQIAKDYQSQMEQAFSQTHSGGNVDHKKWQATIQRIGEERKSAFGAVLLPHQKKRLQQIATQMEFRNRGDFKTLTGDLLAEELGIDDQQKRELQQRSEEINRELAEGIERLKQEAREKLIRTLRPDQRRKLEQLVGEKFEHRKNSDQK